MKSAHANRCARTCEANRYGRGALSDKERAPLACLGYPHTTSQLDQTGLGNRSRGLPVPSPLMCDELRAQSEWRNVTTNRGRRAASAARPALSRQSWRLHYPTGNRRVAWLPGVAVYGEGRCASRTSPNARRSPGRRNRDYGPATPSGDSETSSKTFVKISSVERGGSG